MNSVSIAGLIAAFVGLASFLGGTWWKRRDSVRNDFDVFTERMQKELDRIDDALQRCLQREGKLDGEIRRLHIREARLDDSLSHLHKMLAQAAQAIAKNDGPALLTALESDDG